MKPRNFPLKKAQRKAIAINKPLTDQEEALLRDKKTKKNREGSGKITRK